MKNKIAIFIPSLEFGGAERVTVRLAKEFSKTYDVSIITFKLPVKKEYILPENVQRLFVKKTSFVKKIIEIRRIIKSIEPKFVITMFAPLYITTGFALLFSNIPHIVSERNDPRNFSGKLTTKILYQKMIKYASGVVFQTSEAFDYYFKNGNHKKVIIPNPVVNEELPNPYQGKRKEVVVNVGRLHHQKNQIMLINAFCNIHKQIPNFKLIIYGEGELRNKLEDIINARDANDYIHLYGATTNVLNEIREASLFVLSSDFEGMPNALIEAMCMGLPVISTDCPCGGPRELIMNGKNGILVEKKNQKALEQEILNILFNAGRANELAIEAVKLRKSLDIVKISEKWVAFCESLC